MLIETHAHLDYPDFANDLDDVLGRATEAGVTRVITIGTSVESSRRAINLAEKHPNIYAVIGVHPTYAEEAEEDVITPLRELANSRRVVGIGETGLDYHHLPSVEAAKEKNVQVFARAFQGETEEDTGVTAVYLGPQMNFTWGQHLGAYLAADLPISIDNTALQTVPDYRIRGGLSWHF